MCRTDVHMIKTRTLRRILDVVILIVVVMGVAYYLPKLLRAVEGVNANGPAEPDWDPRYPRALLTLGMVPLVGSVLMLVPCLSLFSTPLAFPRRFFLGLLCAVPLVLALVGISWSPPGLWKTFVALGLLSSLGVWLLGLPAVVANMTFVDLAARWFAKRRRPRRAARRPNR
jgi:hypothetical protein